MATNYIQPGAVFDYANDTGSDIESGDVVPVGAAIGVALVDIADGESGSVQTEGVFSAPKGSNAITQGMALIWDASENAFDDPAEVTAAAGDIEGNAIAFEAAEAGDSTVKVKLTGNPGDVTS